jgi:hypothetical protein
LSEICKSYELNRKIEIEKKKKQKKYKTGRGKPSGPESISARSPASP